ncbi:MAG TPA: trypsin-like peptidase domain-containing protein [Dehalococcoidia bacterium]|nr:trypsin-like peptidase domain-containing protein [Dehalococcoidia bacterium]
MAEETVLSELSTALADAVEKAAGSTVTVSARRRLAATGIAWTNDSVLTASHVVERDDDIKIGLPDGGKATAKLVGRDPGSDLAVLKLNGGQLTPAERAPDGSAKVGYMVLAVGRPSDEGPMASGGVVSAIGGAWRTYTGGQVEGYIRADVTFYPGFSGGPLIDSEGRVVGINTSRLGRGAGLTIPVASAARIADALLSQGRIKRGYLGIGNQPVQLPAGLASKAGQDTGLLVVSVEAGTSADKAGMLVGDIVVKLSGSPVKDTDDLQALLNSESVGKATTITLLRGGELTELAVTPGERV